MEAVSQSQGFGFVADVEVAEVLEHFQWRTGDEMNRYAKEHAHDIAEELADVLLLGLAYEPRPGIDILQALDAKLTKAEEKYPVEKARGNHMKYTEFAKE